MEDGLRTNLSVQQERAILVVCLLPGNSNDPHDPLNELRALTDTAGAIVVDELIQNRMHTTAATFIGSGKVKELAELAKAHEADVIIFDNDLSPSQIGNIEKIVEVKVLDRSELILDIFAARARTHEARLQVELAQLQYTYPRLRSMWSHLERIAGGSPAGIGTRGPGEQQLETDRRIVQRRKSELLREIVRIQSRKKREVAQRNQDFFTVGLVGYTNAGKSTLFNRLTQGGAYADDKLFATLSTRTRRWDFEQGDSVMLSDTVGFVRDLPHHLIASFRATLEEAIGADLLLVVLDVSHPRATQQLQTVLQVLDDIGATQAKRLLVFNKVDRLENNVDLLLLTKEHPTALAISAATGDGIEQLMTTVREISQGGEQILELAFNMKHGRIATFLERSTEIIDRQYQGDEVMYHVRIGQRQLDQLKAMGGSIRIINPTHDQQNTKRPNGWETRRD